ncbi:50S ribosomal protein L4 [Stratiformator vulcanicus]|uniref:Large ribosomal subunit protein uL4 n=1 Tax=Stratiformator vulcanicus TaxID=2527980 RepID=A0A517R0Z9_9PLAN|nr:50S ribosomal protein L4 [Stratiformator vulcanicus]QDT37523.1 50S ribosomal protein L4 [Stratiformator vulcanicus]
MTETISQDIKVPVKTASGGDAGSYEFASTDLAAGINKQLLHDVVVMYLANKRLGSAQTKSRGMVAGSKKKMYRQKGTGNARAGSKRSPIRKGGGHTFAKVPRDFSYRLPKKAVRLATRMALLSKFIDDQATVIEDLPCSEYKTKTVTAALEALGLSEKSCLLVIGSHDPVLWGSARNIATLETSPACDLNAYDLLRQRNLLITSDALDRMLGKKPLRDEEAQTQPEGSAA